MTSSYRLTLEVRSPLVTPLAADTLWGHIAWGLRWYEGEAHLVEWLRRYDELPPLVLSNPLPTGFWPRPAVPAPPRDDQPPDESQAAKRKKLAAIRWLPNDVWHDLAGCLTAQALADALQSLVDRQHDERPAMPSPGRVQAVTHAGVNRFTGGTGQPAGGSLFTVDHTFYPRHARFDVWTLSPEPLPTVRRWFEQGLEGGYGRDAATGAGQLAVVDAQPAQLPSVPAANAGVALGAFTPAPRDPRRGFFKAGARCGRLGGDFAIGPLPGGATQRQKRPVSVFEEGTLLVAAADSPPVSVGRVLRGVHQWPDIRHYSMTLLLPCRLGDELLAHPLLQPTPASTLVTSP